jgi:hypothetical protein
VAVRGTKLFQKICLHWRRFPVFFDCEVTSAELLESNPPEDPKAPVEGVMVWLRVIRPREEAIEIGNRYSSTTPVAHHCFSPGKTF